MMPQIKKQKESFIFVILNPRCLEKFSWLVILLYLLGIGSGKHLKMRYKPCKF